MCVTLSESDCKHKQPLKRIIEYFRYLIIISERIFDRKSAYKYILSPLNFVTIQILFLSKQSSGIILVSQKFMKRSSFLHITFIIFL